MCRRFNVVLCGLVCLLVVGNVAVSLGDYAAYVNGLNPTGYYRLNETVSGTVSDSSGNALDAVHMGSPTLNVTPGAPPAVPDSAIGGSDRIVDFAGVAGTLFAQGNNPFSLNLWVKPDGFQAYATQLSYGRGVDVGSPWRQAFIIGDAPSADGKLELGKYAEGFLTSTGAMVDGQWNSIGITHDGTTLSLYLNGAFDSSATVALNVAASGGCQGTLGGLFEGGQAFVGQLDEFAYFNGTVLGGSAMAQLAGVPEPSTIVLLSIGLLGLLAYAWRKRK